MIRILFIHYFLLLIYCNSQPILDDIFLKDYEYEECIKTTILRNSQNYLLDPIIKLNSEETLKLSFDDLDNNLEYYLYTFIHCNSNWEESEIIYAEYLDGFQENYIENYSFSFNTIQDYIHYELIFPNENIKFLKSGNYIILVYDENMKPIITKRFIVQEDIVKIDSNLKRGTFVKDFYTKHEIDFKINLNNLVIQNPYEEIKIIIQQNDNWNNVKKNIRPSFISQNVLEYDYEEEISFYSGNEFRHFETSNLDFFSENVDSIYTKEINKEDPRLNIELCNSKFNYDNILFASLKRDYNRERNSYFNKYDLNGKMQIKNSRSNYPEYESEYIMVDFLLENDSEEKLEVYIFGAISNWNIDEKYKMCYDPNSKKYQASLFLKQGYYDYQYITNEQNINKIEGNYFETKNEYTIYVYYKPIWSRYERIIGINKITSNYLD